MYKIQWNYVSIEILDKKLETCQLWWGMYCSATFHAHGHSSEAHIVIIFSESFIKIP
jgi:hypothetical protein